jgi:hypothetical protein
VVARNIGRLQASALGVSIAALADVCDVRGCLEAPAHPSYACRNEADVAHLIYEMEMALASAGCRASCLCQDLAGAPVRLGCDTTRYPTALCETRTLMFPSTQILKTCQRRESGRAANTVCGRIEAPRLGGEDRTDPSVRMHAYTCVHHSSPQFPKGCFLLNQHQTKSNNPERNEICISKRLAERRACCSL